MKKKLLVYAFLLLGFFSQASAQGNNPYVFHIYNWRSMSKGDSLVAQFVKWKFEVDYVKNFWDDGYVPRYSRNGKPLFQGGQSYVYDFTHLTFIILYATVADNFGFSFTEKEMSDLAGSVLSGYTGIVVDFSEDNLAVNSDNFLDENFRVYLQSQSYGKDYVLTPDEISGIKEIDVNEKEISSLDGINYFTALTSLNCCFNNLTSLDVSKNKALTEIYCSYNLLTSLDVSKNTALELLDCTKNYLTSLDLSKNIALTGLGCSHNLLKSLDVSKNKALTEIYCSYNLLTSLDVSKNTALTYFNCHDNLLTSLDVSKNTALTDFYCHYNDLTSLDVSKNTALVSLFCGFNQLTSLDVSKNTALELLDCTYNYLTSLDLSKNIALTELGCSYNLLTSLDLSKNTALDFLTCVGNQLTSLDVSKNKTLTEIYCYKGQIKGAQAEAFVNSLPTVTGGKLYFFNLGNTEEGNEITVEQVAKAKAKGWTVYAWDSSIEDYVEYAGTSGISQPEQAETEADRTYTLDGRPISGQPTKKGIYIRGSKKVLVK